MTFKEFLNEDKITDVTGAKRAILSKSNAGKTFSIRKWTEDEIEKWGVNQTTKYGAYKWEIDNSKPDFKTSFPIDNFMEYYDSMKTKAINVQKALEDIGKGNWKPA